jgi:bifunctional non-homologous end joining protein LigD
MSKPRSVLDGEAIVSDDSGLAVFDLIHGHGTLANAVHCAFDLLELDGNDVRRLPIDERNESEAIIIQSPTAGRYGKSTG